ncbi:MAG TPA: hypothetical protein VM802_18265 [Chitinophaga sp.]|uniref:hypothetical protein n=1 Tax=Chitinophaga sp. TaxID=1869181 RepID=UPI002C0E3A23|nr:hypothetical protein [Chitinophaga sp.]HVI46830.1 hypothetical protein [Chitinophaga sp.]
MKSLSLLVLICYSSIAFGQQLNAVKDDLQETAKRIHANGNYSQGKPDSLDFLNTLFEKKLLYYTAHIPAMLTTNLGELSPLYFQTVTTDNNRLKIYSWDTEAGGTMHFLRNVFQYKSGNKLRSVTLKKKGWKYAGEDYVSLYTMKNKGKTYYLGVYLATYSNRDSHEGIKVFEIKNNRLKDNVRLIRTKKGLKSQLGFTYDFFSVYKREERPIILTKFDPATKTISIPVVKQDGTVTDKNIRYRFTGEYFKRVTSGK